MPSTKYKIVSIEENTLVTEESLFYAQGGGQPSDKGIIKHDTHSKLSFSVNKVLFKDGKYFHFGIGTENFEVGQFVYMEIDSSLRDLHSRCHSAGHLIDHAIDELGWDCVPIKGYHFPEGPYVQYSGKPPSSLSLLQEKCLEIIKRNVSVKEISVITKECPPAWKALLDEQGLGRQTNRFIVFDGFDLPRPCSGTHVKKTMEIGDSFTIRKCKNLPDKTFRISYKLK